MKELKLKNNNPDKYVVVKLSDGTMFVHDKESGRNFFSQKAIAVMFGLSISAVSRLLKQYKNIQKEKKSNLQNLQISLNVFDSDKPVVFHSFSAVTHVAYRSNSPNAVDYRDYIEEAINEKFNKDAGFTKSIEPSHEDKILSRAKKQQAKIRMETDSLYVELNFGNPSYKKAKEILKKLDELKPEELRINRQIKNIENCIGSLGRETSARSQSTLLDFNNRRLPKK